jgi:uncharacterized protein (DUF1697 family)
MIYYLVLVDPLYISFSQDYVKQHLEQVVIEVKMQKSTTGKTNNYDS